MIKLILTTLFAATVCRISIIKPTEEKRDVDYELSAFGFVDYQASVELQLFRWHTLGGCESPTDQTLQLKSSYAKAFIMKRGQCTYKQQAINAHRAGARLVLIYRDDDANIHDSIPVNPAISQHEYKLPPVAIITRREGEALVSALDSGKQVVFAVDHEIQTFKPPLSVRLVFSPVHLESLGVLKALLPLTLKNSTSLSLPMAKLLLAPKISTRQAMDFSEAEAERFCVPSSHYCSPRFEDVKMTRPFEYVHLAVYLHCMSSVASADESSHGDFADMVDRYINALQQYYHANIDCDLVSVVDAHLRSIERPYHRKVTQCFLMKMGNDRQNPNIDSVSLDELYSSSSQQVDKLPSLYLNELLVRGDVDASTAVSALCDSVEAKYRTHLCSEVTAQLDRFARANLDAIEEDRLSWLALLLLMLVCVCVIGWTGRWLLSKQVDRDISREIDSTLSKYYQMANTKIEVDGDHELRHEG